MNEHYAEMVYNFTYLVQDITEWNKGYIENKTILVNDEFYTK